MHDLDPFERRLGAALRSDADENVGPFEAEAVARAAIDGIQGPSRLGRVSSRPAGRFGRGRGITLLAAAALVVVGGALAVGSGVLRLPSVTPPAPAPSFALVATPSPAATASPRAITAPTPNASPTQLAVATPSPSPASVNLTWTQVPLAEKDPSLAWVVDRFVIADQTSGAVRTSLDGTNWQTMQSDAAPGYVALLNGRIATWQDQAVGWVNANDLPDISNAPPVSRTVTIVRPPAVPISTTPFKGPIESIAIGPKGFVAESHSAIDFEHWVTRKLGLRVNNDWTMHTKSLTLKNGVLDLKLNNRSGLKLVWADQGFQPGDFYDGGFGWYSPDGEHWTEMAQLESPDAGSTLPTRSFGQVVGVSDGFIASGGTPDTECYNGQACGGGMWFSADGLTWRFLGPGGGDGLPWMGGALVNAGSGEFEVWTSNGSSKLPVPAGVGSVATGPLGVVGFADGQKFVVSRNGIDYGSSPVPDEMANANHGGRSYHPTIAVGDRTVLVLEKFHDEAAGKTSWSLWLGTVQS